MKPNPADPLSPKSTSHYDIDRYFEIQDRWLELEGESERERMQRRRQFASRDRAEKTGETLLRMQLNDHSTGLGGRYLLDFVKPNQADLPHNRFRVGSPVVISNDQDDNDAGVAGVVSRRKNYSLQVATDVWPEAQWYRIDISPDETTRRRQQKAMAQIRTAGGRTEKLRNQLMGLHPIRAAKMDSLGDIDWLSDLNPPQKDAVRFALASPDISILHGPPGTGKTTTLAEVVYQAVARGESVLACAASNTAVDNLLEKLIGMMPDVLRVGHPARVFDNLREHTLDQRVESDPSNAVIEDMRREIQGLIRAASKDMRGADARRRKGELYAQAGALRSQIRALERSIIRSILESADVICTTTTIDDELLGDREFDLVVVDEACQCTLPGIWQAVLRAKRMVLAGDHLQLPPTVLNDQAKREGLDESLMQRLIQREGESIFRRLTVQYRMHETIMNFSSQQFYEGSLVADASVRTHRLCELPQIRSEDQTETIATFIDTAGAGHDEKVEVEGESKYNPGEANIVVQMVGELTQAGIQPEDIAVIAPYGAQVRLLRNRIDLPGIEIDTVDGFQGREKEVVIITMVRSNEAGEIGFLSEIRRTNVALTRARRRLIVIGDSATLGRHPFYSAMLDYFDQVGGYRTVWELPDPMDTQATP
jgi:ATP-dependent RNA/DNA helicase IGHMBP2